MKNPIWVTDQGYYIMYCEKSTLCILCEKGLEIIRAYEKKNNIKITLSSYSFHSETKDGQEIIFGFRPEHICLPDASLKSHLQVELKPSLIELTGYEKEVSFEFYGNEITGRLPRHIDTELGKPISLNLDLSEISIFDQSSTLRI